MKRDPSRKRSIQEASWWWRWARKAPCSTRQSWCSFRAIWNQRFGDFEWFLSIPDRLSVTRILNTIWLNMHNDTSLTFHWQFLCRLRWRQVRRAPAGRRSAAAFWPRNCKNLFFAKNIPPKLQRRVIYLIACEEVDQELCTSFSWPKARHRWTCHSWHGNSDSPYRVVESSLVDVPELDFSDILITWKGHVSH